MADNNGGMPVQTAYRQRLSDMLDLTYELEGLLHIGVTRSTVPVRLNHLIVSKLNAIVALADEPARPEEMAASAGAPSVSSGYYSDLNDSGEINDDADNDAFVATDGEVADFDADYDAAPDDGAARMNTAQMNAAEEDVAAENNQVNSEGSGVRPVESLKEDDVVTGIPYPEDYTESDDFSPENSDSEEPERVRYLKPKTGADAGRGQASGREKGRLFSINDRFLYSRELFGGRLADFDAAMDEVVTLDSYDEAEEYFVSEWGFDPENPVAAGFLDIVRRIF